MCFYIDQIFDKLHINDCILSVGQVHEKMKMLENNQQGTESRTALVEDRVDVVEDRVNVVEDSVHHLQDNLSIFLFIRRRDSVNTFCDLCD